MADVKPPSTKVTVVALRGFWQGPAHIATGQLARLSRRDAREAIASKIAREATDAEIKLGKSADAEAAEKEAAAKAAAEKAAADKAAADKAAADKAAADKAAADKAKSTAK